MQIRLMIRRNSARPSAVRLTERCRRDIYYQNEDRVSKGAAVDRNDLLNGFKRYYGISTALLQAIRKSMPPMTGCFCMEIPEKPAKEI